ncbi:MAG: Holliday junction resolvase RuvX [Patescibacteria group bacterium]|nr:Holliday junction resolvase RuvX [Patescibacteria group bacterium]
MKFIGVDYGLKKIGIAVSDGLIAEPHLVINVKNENDALDKLTRFIKLHDVSEVIIGISEGEMAYKTKKFVQRLKSVVDSKIVFQDETLSTKRAQKLSIEIGKRRIKRRKMEDAYAAAVLLQDYLDLH